MSSTIYTLKYSVAEAAGVVGQQPFQENAKFSNLFSWKLVDKLNKLREFSITIPNDEFGRANALIEREAYIPFLKPLKGVVTARSLDESTIDLTITEFAWHLTRRIFRILTDDIIDHVPSNNWYNTAWKYRRKIIVNGDQVDDSLTGIALQTHNEHGITQPVIPVEAQSDGRDFFVTASDGITPIPYEIDYWNSSTNELVIRFRPTKLKDSNNTIAYIYFGNPSAVDAQNSAGVWGDNYAAVYHCTEDVAVTNLVDSTGNGNTGTPTNCTRGGGHHGTGIVFNGTNSKVECGSGSFIDNIFAPTTGGKFDCWLYPNSDGEGDQGIIATKVQWTVRVVDELAGFVRLQFEYSFSGSTATWRTNRIIPIGSQTKIAIEYDNGSTANDPVIYINGEPVSITETIAPSGTANSDAGSNLTLGNNTGTTNTFDGWLDEIRLHRTIRGPIWERADYRNETMDTNEIPWFLRWENIELREQSVADIAQEILDSANTDMPAGVTWTLGEGIPTTITTIKFKSKNHYEALHHLGESIGKDVWFDNDLYKVYIGTKGKNIDDDLDIIITTKPKKSTDNFANKLNIIGDRINDIQLKKYIDTSTVLRYNYEKIVTDTSLGTESQLEGVGNLLIESFQKLNPVIKGTIPYNQFVRFNLGSGDIIKIIQPEKQLIGSFRVLDLSASQTDVKLTLESVDSGVVRTKSLSLPDIIEGILKKLQDQSID